MGAGEGRMSRLLALGRRIYREYEDDRVADSAAVLAFYFVFSLFPFLFFLTTLVAYMPKVQSAAGTLLDRIRPIIPGQAMSLIEGHVHALVSTPRPRLLTFGLATTLYSASRGVDAVRNAMNRAYEVRDSRPFWRTELLALGVTIGGAALVLLAIVALVIGGDLGAWVARHLHLPSWVMPVVRWGRWPVTAMALLTSTALCYNVLPDRRGRRRFLTPGSVFATVAWFAASWGFGYYAGHFGRYNITYGSIGSVIILLVWFYITGFILIMGGEINAALERRRRDDRQGDRRPNERPVADAAPPAKGSPPPVKDWTGVPTR